MEDLTTHVSPTNRIAAAGRASVPPGLGLLDLAAARRAVADASRALGVEQVALAGAVGRFLGQPYVAPADLVPYGRSAMDGYAMRAADTAAAATAPLLMPVRGRAFAGDPPARVERGHASAIATGAALPIGTDAVVPWEDVDVRGDAIVVRAALRAGEHVFPPGDDARAGDVVAGRGDRLTAGRIAVLAALGIESVAVHRRPRVTIVSTGDEIVAPSVEPRAGQIRDSNAAMLCANVARDGGSVVAFMHAPDRQAGVEAVLREACAISDLVVTTGGASAGERDYVKRAATALGADFAFGSVALRPAKPTAFARCGAALLAVLPGNPAAAFVAYTALFGPLVRALAGDPQPALPVVSALLDGTLNAKPGRQYFAFARLRHDGNGFAAEILANQCSSLVRTSADANAFVVVPPGSVTYAPGAPVEAEVFDWPAVAFSSGRFLTGI